MENRSSSYSSNGTNKTADELIEDGIKYYKQKNYPKAVEIFLSLAEGGNAKAQGMLGACYENGIGVPQNYAKAVEWYQKAAE